MAKLTAAKRRKLPRSAFVYPKTRSYPIGDTSHARAALRMSARKDTKASHSTVKAAVCKRYPSLGACRKGK